MSTTSNPNISSSNVAVPMKSDAFVLNIDVFDQDALIAPIIQPNYSLLRIQDFVLQNDTLAQVDVYNARPVNYTIPEVEAWVVESDTLQMIDDLEEDVDLQVDVSPFIGSTEQNAKHPGKTSINEQVEVFIGKKLTAASWSETTPPTPAVDLSLLNSSNHLFPDYQPHNSNVFSIIDNLTYYDSNNKHAGCLTDAVADYYVIGWHGGNSVDPFCQAVEAHQDILKYLPLEMRDPNLDAIQG
ncbi:hypothetical protein FPANT_11395 [Fusarium pseudoanthophilum]|uniref:Uncharacterized protein n=1 Tax=Fusarium pseudoanthophilum TaxID=48495 RepID=A0A8H5KN35_9HYPO|nr:hypothetical protein FPANT_11395 [Fusarium pseudoanthophilum]